jgi:hypothetical protein
MHATPRWRAAPSLPRVVPEIFFSSHRFVRPIDRLLHVVFQVDKLCTFVRTVLYMMIAMLFVSAKIAANAYIPKGAIGYLGVFLLSKAMRWRVYVAPCNAIMFL